MPYAIKKGRIFLIKVIDHLHVVEEKSKTQTKMWQQLNYLKSKNTTHQHKLGWTQFKQSLV
jgi:hypothetical protein